MKVCTEAGVFEWLNSAATSGGMTTWVKRAGRT
jgi:hypothetical protein